jgi:hypothetical protein
MTDPDKKLIKKLDKNPAQSAEAKSESLEASEKPPVPHGKRIADVDPTRFGDWELNGRCIDF